MALESDLEMRISAAVTKYAAAANAGRPESISELAEITSSLPIRNMEAWELVVRGGIDRASEPPRWRVGFKPKPIVTWLDLCSRDGFDRELALRSLSSAAPNRFFLAIAVRRLNDWVPQIRAAARKRLLSIAIASNPEDVVDVLWAILPHWQTWTRNEPETRQTLLEIVALNSVAHGLKVRISSASAGPAARIFTQAARTPALDRHLVQITEEAEQPSVRAKAFRFLLEGKAVWVAHRDRILVAGFSMPILESRDLTVEVDFERTLVAASEDPSPAVRRIAADMLCRPDVRAPRHVLVQLATKLALDRFPSVADRAKFALRELSEASSEPIPARLRRG